MKKITWRLSKLPTPDEVRELVRDKILTQNEAREILFKEEEKEKDRDIDSFKDEIKFLRDLVEAISKGNRNTVVEHIYSHTYPQPWYHPYTVWCGQSGYMYVNSAVAAGSTFTTSGLSQSSLTTGGDISNQLQSCTTASSGDTLFTDIQTF